MPAADFVEAFAGWVRDHPESHVGFLATAGGEPVGMAFLAVIERIPGPGRWERRAGALQSVYVQPEERGAGVGTRLCEAALEEAVRRGLDYVTVHPSERSFPLYRRLGFTGSGSLLELDLRDRNRGA
jgi:GNAT superfamily N-acetyltransferase